ncbi:hypothetical protein [Streptomyces sp. NPDC088178]|uniref:hypothetical protein n=1 Tax=Streptomyces sp. NPDC088178 TaxID=3365836 RepID=UPI003807D6DB
MSDTATQQAPPDTDTGAATVTSVVDGPDGQSLPIEIILNQNTDGADTVATTRGPRSALRAWPLALFGAEAASTGASALYASAGTAGVLTVAGVAAGGGVIAAATAARRARKSKAAGGGGRVLRGSGHRSTLGSTGIGRSGGRGSGPGRTGGGGRSGGRGRSSGLGATSAGASTHRTGPRHSPTSRNGGSVPKKPFTSSSTFTGAGSAGRGSASGKSGAGNPGRDAAGGRGGTLRRLSLRKGAGKSSGPGAVAGATGKGQGSNSVNSPGSKGSGRGRSTLAA